MNKFALREIGDISWPEHLTIFTIPVQIALQYNVKLILWGENLKMNMVVQQALKRQNF